MARATTGEKNAALFALAQILGEESAAILEANARDLRAARDNQLDEALLDRLELNPNRVAAMADGVRQVAALPDPVGEILDLKFRPSGIQVGRMRVPLGVVGIIYESRPNVTADAGALCLKAGNACILRGGSDSFWSSKAVQQCLTAGLREAGLPEVAITLVPTPDRAAVGAMLAGLGGNLDVIVPRGGKALVARVETEA